MEQVNGPGLDLSSVPGCIERKTVFVGKKVFFDTRPPTSYLLYAPTWTPTEEIIHFFPLIKLSSVTHCRMWCESTEYR